MVSLNSTGYGNTDYCTCQSHYPYPTSGPVFNPHRPPVCFPEPDVIPNIKAKVPDYLERYFEQILQESDSDKTAVKLLKKIGLALLSIPDVDVKPSFYYTSSNNPDNDTDRTQQKPKTSRKCKKYCVRRIIVYAAC